MQAAAYVMLFAANAVPWFLGLGFYIGMWLCITRAYIYKRSLYVYIFIYTHVYIYIYITRSSGFKSLPGLRRKGIYMYIYIYIYIYIYTKGISIWIFLYLYTGIAGVSKMHCIVLYSIRKY